MKKASMFIAFGFLLLIVGVSAAHDKEFKGHITDSMCGNKHMMEDVSTKECADKCVKGGGSYALFVPDDDKMYEVDDQDKAKEFAGANVLVKGSVSDDGKTIKVSSIAKQE
ncbi:MAG: hypothetical protein BMS9Abin37_3226 [Acidobacteriota bacterium]|nr:MAG: hypothetical protein BMS9Abin37_3226 [Acidobacteriota bacterium]